MPSRRRAFTLVELLVVCGIVAVLIGLAFPVLSRARQHANRAACAANLRSIGQALVMYTQQYRYYPGYCAHDADARNLYVVWPVRLRAFTGGDQGVFYCPSQDERCRWVKGALPPDPADAANAAQAKLGYEIGERVLWVNGVPFSYGYNARGCGAPGARALGYFVGAFDDRELPAPRVRIPSEMVAIADSDGDGRFDLEINPLDPAAFPGRVHPGRVHFGGPNVLYCDGHVQWSPLEDLVLLSSPTSAAEAERWGRTVRMWNCDHIWYVGFQ